MTTKTGRIAIGLAFVIGATGAIGSGIAIRANSAKADDSYTGNTWYYTMTDPNKDGMELKGVAGSNRQIFEVKDPYGAPIFSVGHVGGANVYGDDLRIFNGGDVFDPTAIIYPDGHIEITAQSTNPVIVVNGQTLTANDIKWIHDHE